MNKVWLVALHLSTIAYADKPPSFLAPQGVSAFIPLLLIFGIFYFLMIRPQQKKAKQHQKFLTELKRGDMVITNAGIIGLIKSLSEKFIMLEVDNGVCLKVLRNQILESANNLKEAKPA